MSKTKKSKKDKRTEPQRAAFEEAVETQVQKLLHATREAFAITGTPGYFAPDLLAIADRLGLDRALVEGGWETGLGFRWQREVRPTWGLKTDLSVDFESPYVGSAKPTLQRDYLDKLRVDVSWPSGGGAPADAVAQASQHLELAQHATRIQMVYRGAITPPDNRYSQLTDEDRHRVIPEAFSRLKAKREEAWDQIRAELPDGT